MKQRWYEVRVLLAVLAALTLSVPAMAAQKPLPFQGRSSGVITAVGFDPVAGIAYNRVEGEGRATQLGRFTVTADVALNVATGIPHGTWMLTAANGDQLFLTMTGHGIDPLHGLGAFTIVGGTGRFAGATGSYEQLITFGAEPGTQERTPYSEVFEGTIAY